ncbi:MAG: hypothetical protein ACREEM_32600 [Blastocatellia bacterium]
MNCAYHPIHTASIRCISCGRALCAACDHRIKGNPHCQDCIVAGIAMLGRANASGQRPLPQDAKSPVIALLLGLIPGLGAAYNGQNVKALVHFTVTAGLLTLSDIFNWPLEAVLGLGGFAFYCYSLYDAFASAQQQRSGEDLSLEDEQLKQFLRERTHIWGVMLIGLGCLTALDIAFPALLGRFWPLLLIAAGFYFLRSWQSSRRVSESNSIYRTPPPSVIPPAYDRSTGDFAGADSRYDR